MQITLKHWWDFTLGDQINLKHVIPDSKVHGAHMGPTWVLSAQDGPPCWPYEPCYPGLDRWASVSILPVKTGSLMWIAVMYLFALLTCMIILTKQLAKGPMALYYWPWLIVPWNSVIIFIYKTKCDISINIIKVDGYTITGPTHAKWLVASWWPVCCTIVSSIRTSVNITHYALQQTSRVLRVAWLCSCSRCSVHD